MRNAMNERADTSDGRDGALGGCPLSAVSWPAIIAGAFAAAVASLALLMLGSSLGFAMVSPWSDTANAAVKFTAYTAIWLIVIQWLSSALGGYLTGRLRVRWGGTDVDEVFFRDTAHGFLAWAVATVFTAAFLATAAASVVSGGAQAVATVAAGAAAGAANQAGDEPHNTPLAYYVDNLYRSSKPVSASRNDVNAETLRIMAKGVKNDGLADDDKAYLGQLVMRETGLTERQASERVDDVLADVKKAETEVRKAADTARKTASTVSLFTFLSMLIGAFVASVAAVLGGRNRDEY